MKYYLKYTEQLRANHTKPFLILLTGSKRDVSKVTLSNWVKEVIKPAHSKATDEDTHLDKVSTHELRALSTSILFNHTHSLQAVMGAACWTNHNTFSQFYLRDITLTNDKIMSLGSIVAGQSVIGPTLGSRSEIRTHPSKKTSLGRVFR